MGSLGNLSMGGLDGGAGGISPDFSSSAASGDATTGANSITVGGFNPPMLQGKNSMLLAGVAVVALFVWFKK